MGNGSQGAEGGKGAVPLRWSRLAGAVRRDCAEARPASLAQPCGALQARPTRRGTRACRPCGAAAHGERERAGAASADERVWAPSWGLWEPRRASREPGEAELLAHSLSPSYAKDKLGYRRRWVLGAGTPARVGPGAANRRHLPARRVPAVLALCSSAASR